MAQAKSWEPSAIDKAAKLWAKGVSVHFISKEMGVSKDAVIGLCDRRRDLFPARRAVTAVKKNDPMPEVIIVERKLPANQVVRTTLSGKKVTMPRVTFIDGPAPGASA